MYLKLRIDCCQLSKQKMGIRQADKIHTKIRGVGDQ